MTAALFSSPALAGLNHVLDQADWARLKLQPFAGRSVRIAMAPFALSFTISGDGRLQGSDATAKPADLDIILPIDTPLRALQGSERVMAVAQISGPADLADALSFVLGRLRWDIEEDLSKVVGDVAAHRIVSMLDAFAAWQRQAARNLAENVGEYLTEESLALVKPVEIAVFAEEVGRLHSSLAQLEQRIARLAR